MFGSIIANVKPSVYIKRSFPVPTLFGEGSKVIAYFAARHYTSQDGVVVNKYLFVC
jgi:hypothetical protein